MPEVNGMASSPARRIVSRRASGSLSGDPWCAAPRSSNRRETFSSISPLRRADLTQREQLVPREDPRIGVRQQAGRFEHRPRGRDEVRHRRRVAECGQFLACLRVALLRPVAQREERFPAPRLRAAPRDLDRFVDRQISAFARPRRLRERAVVADVAAELRKRDEDLARVADRATETGVPKRRGPTHQRLKFGCPHQVRSGLARRWGIGGRLHLRFAKRRRARAARPYSTPGRQSAILTVRRAPLPAPRTHGGRAYTRRLIGHDEHPRGRPREGADSRAAVASPLWTLHCLFSAMHPG